jgi:hypothetical protein
MLWKNGTPSLLAPATNGYSAAAYSAFVSGNDVYVVGFESLSMDYDDPSHDAFPLLWKNGAPQRLDSAGFSEGYARSVFVSGNDVYVAGYGNDYEDAWTSRPSALIWKNGVMTRITSPDDGLFSEASSIFVSGNDVYVAGEERSAQGAWVAKLWKNGAAQNLGGNGDTANSVFVSGNDVYVAGCDASGNALLWKNGTAQNLTNGSYYAYAYSVCVSGNDVYVSGEESNAQGAWIAKLWKNGAAQNLGGNGEMAYSVFVSGNDVYVAGWDASDNALLWKNGTAQTLGYGCALSVTGK